MVQSPDIPNVNQNPLPTYTGTNMLELILSDEEVVVLSNLLLRLKMMRKSQKNLWI